VSFRELGKVAMWFGEASTSRLTKAEVEAPGVW
jgi:hypothetical protein